MSGPRPLVGLADLLKSFRALEVDDDATRAAMTRILGLEPDLPVVSRGRTGTGLDTRPPPSQPDGPGGSLPTGDASVPSSQVDTDLVPLPREVDPSLLPLGPALKEARAAGDIEVEPLFDPRWSRSLLTGVARTESAQGSIDIEALVDRVARAKPIQSLPRGPSPTLRRGVQVLVDVSDVMLPFSRDQERVVKRLQDLVGIDGVEVVRFEGCPRMRRIGADPDEGGWYNPPRRQTPVVALTDLGAGRALPGSPRVTAEDWIAVARAIGHTGSSLIALVPYPVARVDEDVRRVVTVVTWDRSTRPSATLKATRGTGVGSR